MWIVAVAWIYVVALMAATEPSFVHGLMTFLFYCALPLSIVFYLTGSKRRRARREARARDNKDKQGDNSEAANAPEEFPFIERAIKRVINSDVDD